MIGRRAAVRAILHAMRRLQPVWLIAHLAIAPTIFVTAPDARADDQAAASALIEQGLDLRQAQRDAEALVLFEKAEALAPSPRGQAQVALAEQALGRWVSAERNLRAALAAKDDAWIASRRPVLEHAMGVIQAHLGDVEIIGAKSGVVYVDGARIDEPDAMTHLRLDVGRRTFELRATGAYPFSRVLDVRPGEVVRVEVDVHPLLDDPSSHTRVPPPAPSAPVPASHAQRTIGWVALGGAGLLAGTGAAGLAFRAVAANDFNASSACTTEPSNALSSQCRGWLSDGTTGQTLAIVGFVGAGLFGALSLALLLTAPSSAPRVSTITLPCAPTRGGVSCGVGGSF